MIRTPWLSSSRTTCWLRWDSIVLHPAALGGQVQAGVLMRQSHPFDPAGEAHGSPGRDHGLGRNAVPQVGAAADDVALDERDLGTEPGGVGGSSVSPGPSADDDYAGRHALTYRLGWYTPNSARRTSLTSPRVARRRRASRIGGSRLALPLAAATTSARAASTAAWSRSARVRRTRSIWWAWRAGSMGNTSPGSGWSSICRLTPTITLVPLSTALV